MAQTDAAGKTARVLIVDDHPTVREGLGHRISSQPDMTVCGDAADMQEALQQIADLNPDVAIIDIALKNSDGLELIKALKARHKHVRMVVHSMYDELVYADRCLRAGAMGYVNKEAHPDEVIQAIRTVLAGRIHVSPAITSQILGRTAGGGEPGVDPIDTLTDRQLEIFRLIGAGRTAAQIGEQLHISVHTVETHRDNIKHKLNVNTVPELTRIAVLWATAKR